MKQTPHAVRRSGHTAYSVNSGHTGQSGEARIFLIQDDNLTAEVPLRRSILQSTLRQKYRSTGRHNPQRDGGPEKGLYRLRPIALPLRTCRSPAVTSTRPPAPVATSLTLLAMPMTADRPVVGSRAPSREMSRRSARTITVRAAPAPKVLALICPPLRTCRSPAAIMIVPPRPELRASASTTLLSRRMVGAWTSMTPVCPRPPVLSAGGRGDFSATRPPPRRRIVPPPLPLTSIPP